MEDSYLAYEAYSVRCAELGGARPCETRGAGRMAPRPRRRAQLRPRSASARHHRASRRFRLANGIYAVLRANDTRHEKPLAQGGDHLRMLESLRPIYKAAERLGMLRAKDYQRKSGRSSLG